MDGQSLTSRSYQPPCLVLVASQHGQFVFGGWSLQAVCLCKAITERVQPIVTGGHGMLCVRKWQPIISNADKRSGVNECYRRGDSREKCFKTGLGDGFILPDL